ncbi:MAG: flagellar biosynthetic protein FliO [Desulfobulbaceae bacterium]|uniref:Flagellar biosynthetic protein FliO n=1 Tax=Candidatus Desulfobia pelagia TaxID=2841692 RepID=A0A8J6NDR6_9BACT|nr:flagellar biosynthetic protein FliO [Candidatus Desulfobia pelagia]
MHISHLIFSFLLLTSPLKAWAEGVAVGESVPTGQTVDFASSANLATTLFKVAGALALVVGLMILLIVWLKKMGLAKGGLRQGSLVQLLDSKMIAPKKYVAVVQVGSDLLALGVSDQQITMLHRLDSGNTGKQSPVELIKKKETSFSGFLNKATGTIKDTMRG